VLLADPFGNPLCASPALPGAVHDIKAARTHGFLDALATAGVHCWADKGCLGASALVRVPYRGRWDKLSAGQRAASVSHAKIRALGQQAMATLECWRLLPKLRCSTTRITALIQAVLTLHRRHPRRRRPPRPGDPPEGLIRAKFERINK
jgi:hypothetical protein